MSRNVTQDAAGRLSTPETNAAQLQVAIQNLKNDQNLILGALAGFAASILGAGLWAAVTVASGWQIGWMAVGVGVLVGLAVRSAGRGLDPAYGITGAALSLFGCALGNFLVVCVILARQEGLGVFEVLARINVSAVPGVMAATFGPMDVVFYLLAVLQGYRLSIRPITNDAVSNALGEPKAPLR